MRIWDIPVSKLCRQHLLGEHRELHYIWKIHTTEGKKTSYSNHPEVLRWENNLYDLFIRHKEQIKEMLRRGYNHKSDLSDELMVFRGCAIRPKLTKWQSKKEQIQILKEKGCKCEV